MTSHLDQRLRDLLSESAAEIAPKPLATTELYGAARRRSVRKTTGTVFALLAVAFSSTLFAAQLLRPAPSLPATAPDGPFLGWPMITNTAPSTLIDASLAQWDTAAQTRHTDVRALAAMNDTILGPVVVLEGNDANGKARLAILTGQPRDRTGEQRLTLRADRPAPDPQQTKVISLVTARVGTVQATLPQDASATFVIALAAPGADEVRVQSSAVDQTIGNAGTRGRFLLRPLPPNATAVNTRIQIVKDDAAVAEHSSGLDSGLGDPQMVAATAGTVDTDSHRLTLSMLPTGRPADLVGHLVVSYDGVVGKVVEADNGQTTVETITSPGFSIAVQTNISAYRSRTIGNGSQLVLSSSDEDTRIEKGNRIVLDGTPFDAAGLATIGFADAGCRGHLCNGLILTPAVDTSRLQTVYILP